MSSVRTETISDEAVAARSEEATTRDAFLDGRLTIIQPKSGPRAAIDALFLAAAIPADAGKAQRVLEAGTGTGVASLALCARVEDVQVTGVDVLPSLLALARENARLNGMDGRLTLVESDITAPNADRDLPGTARESFDHAAANPPFFTAGSARRPVDPAAARAYSADKEDLERWVSYLAAMVVPRGTVTFIHRAEALGELLGLLEGRFGALAVYPLYPRDGVPAKRILVQGIKGSRAPLKLLPGMVLHEPDGSYTREADDILRSMEALELDAA